MEAIHPQFIHQPLTQEEIEATYYQDDQIVYSIERTPTGEEVCFYNPEFAFEKQHLENADARKVFSYLKAEPQYQQFLREGFVMVRVASADLNRFVMHIFK